MLWPTLVGALLLALFALDLGFATYGAAQAAPASVAEVFTTWKGIRIALDLAGLAIAGGLYIVPSFAAVQSWAGADQRARVIAADGGTLVVAALQSFGATLPQLFLLLGVANIVALIVIARTMPADGLPDVLSNLLRVRQPGR